MSLRPYAELARLSNIATVLSNVLVGAAIGAAAGGSLPQWWALLVLTLAMMLLYVGGMALNDVFDARVDRVERPGRPIPSGRISSARATGFALCALGMGLVLVSVLNLWASMFALALVACIVLYNLLHKRFVGSVVLMGLCRGLVYITVAAAVAWPLDWNVAGSLALAMTAYIGVVTFIARSEASDDLHSMVAMLRRRVSILLPGIAIVPALWVVPASWDIAMIAGVALLAWLVFAQRHLLAPRPRVKQAVLSYLAGICLIDAFYLTLLERNELAAVAGVCFVVTVLWHTRLSGT